MKITTDQEKYSINVLERAFLILEVLLEARQPLSLEAISSRAQTPKSTTFRIITNLLRHDYLTETDNGYWLGLKWMSFGSAVEDSLDYRRVAAPHLMALRGTTQETVYLATLTREMTVFYVEKFVSDQPVGVVLRSPGMTLPFHCTALGKVMAAYYPEDQIIEWVQQHPLRALTPATITDPDKLLTELRHTRKRGYAVDNIENSDGIACIAAPIRNRRGEVIAALSVAGPVGRMPPVLVGSPMAALVEETARKISTELGCRSFPV